MLSFRVFENQVDRMFDQFPVLAEYGRAYQVCILVATYTFRTPRRRIMSFTISGENEGKGGGGKANRGSYGGIVVVVFSRSG